MKQKFCPKCGKETEDLVDDLCRECFREENEIEVPGELELDICKYCGKLRVEGSWKECSVEEAVESKFEEALDQGVKGKIKKAVGKKNGALRKFKAAVEKGEKGVELSKEGTVEVKFNQRVCETCSSKISGYFEAVLQIRGETEKVREALDLASKVMEESRNDRAFVSDVEEVDNGVNLLVGSNSVAKKIARRLCSEFKAERKESKTLYGEEEGQKKYRSTYLVRILE